MNNKKEMMNTVLADIDAAKKNIRIGQAWKMTMENAWMMNLAQDLLQTKKKAVSLLESSDRFTDEEVEKYYTGLSAALAEIDGMLDKELFQTMLSGQSATEYLRTALQYCDDTLAALHYLQAKTSAKSSLAALLAVIGCYDFKDDLPKIIAKAEDMQRYYSAVSDFSEDDDIDNLPSECFERGDDLCDMYTLSGIIRLIV